MGVKRYLKLYLVLSRFSLVLAMAYKPSFLIELLVELGYTVWFILFFEILYSNVSHVVGWSREEMLFLAGINILGWEILIGTVYVWGVRVLPEKIKDGEIDFALLKPMHSMFQLTLGRPYLSSVITMIPGLLLMGYASQNMTIDWQIWRIVAGTLILVCGMIIMYSILTFFSALSFVFDNAKKLPDIGLHLGDFGARPHQLYNGFFKILFWYIFPVVFLSSLPAEVMIRSGSGWILTQSLLVSAGCLYLVSLFWNRMIVYYSSASS